MDVLFDTGSDWLILEGKGCKSCEGEDLYNPKKSESSKKISKEDSSREYGSASVYGSVYTDTVCVTTSFLCLYDYPLFVAKEQTGLIEPLDGIVGLTRGLPPSTGDTKKSDKIEETSPESLAKALHTSQGIERPSFSIGFDSKEKAAKIEFGRASALSGLTPEERKKPNLPNTTLLIPDDFFWSSVNIGVGIGSTTLKSVWSWENVPEFKTITDNKIYTVFDTGSNVILISGVHYKDFINKIYDYIGAYDFKLQEGVIVTKCYNHFPTLYFKFTNRFL